MSIRRLRAKVHPGLRLPAVDQPLNPFPCFRHLLFIAETGQQCVGGPGGKLDGLEFQVNLPILLSQNGRILRLGENAEGGDRNGESMHLEALDAMKMGLFKLGSEPENERCQRRQEHRHSCLLPVATTGMVDRKSRRLGFSKLKSRCAPRMERFTGRNAYAPARAAARLIIRARFAPIYLNF
jgi:hypothetical protein